MWYKRYLRGWTNNTMTKILWYLWDKQSTIKKFCKPFSLGIEFGSETTVCGFHIVNNWLVRLTRGLILVSDSGSGFSQLVPANTNRSATLIENPTSCKQSLFPVWFDGNCCTIEFARHDHMWQRAGYNLQYDEVMETFYGYHTVKLRAEIVHNINIQSNYERRYVHITHYIYCRLYCVKLDREQSRAEPHKAMNKVTMNVRIEMLISRLILYCINCRLYCFKLNSEQSKL